MTALQLPGQRRGGSILCSGLYIEDLAVGADGTGSGDVSIGVALEAIDETTAKGAGWLRFAVGRDFIGREGLTVLAQGLFCLVRLLHGAGYSLLCGRRGG